MTADAAAVVTNLKRLAGSLAIPVADDDAARSAYASGVDSLVAVSSEIRANVPVVQIPGSSTTAQLWAQAVVATRSERSHGREFDAWVVHWPWVGELGTNS